MKKDTALSILSVMYWVFPFMVGMLIGLIFGEPLLVPVGIVAAILLQILPYYCLQHKILYNTWAVKKSWRLMIDLQDTIPY